MVKESVIEEIYWHEWGYTWRPLRGNLTGRYKTVTHDLTTHKYWEVSRITVFGNVKTRWVIESELRCTCTEYKHSSDPHKDICGRK